MRVVGGAGLAINLYEGNSAGILIEIVMRGSRITMVMGRDHREDRFERRFRTPPHWRVTVIEAINHHQVVSIIDEIMAVDKGTGIRAMIAAIVLEARYVQGRKLPPNASQEGTWGESRSDFPFNDGYRCRE